MKRWAAAVLTAGIVVTGVVALPQAAFAATDVTGTLTKADGTTPIAYGDVTFTSTTDSDNTVATRSQPDGTFATGSLAPGSYTVQFEAYGYAPEYYNDSSSKISATVVTVVDGVPTVVNASLEVESTVTGTVTDDNNAPVYQALVRVYSENDGWEQVREVFTAADGTYSIGSLAAGNVKVFASEYFGNSLQSRWYGGGINQATASLLAVPGAGGSATGDISLPLGAIIKGSVTDPLGLPASVDVTAVGAGLDYDFYGGSYGGDGLYEIGSLHPQDYSVTTSDYWGLFAPSAPELVTTALGSPGTVNFVLAMNLVDESEFTDAVTLVSGPTSVQPGKTYTWQIDIDGSENVYAILYPQPVFVGGAARTSAGPATITLTVPATTKAGDYKLTFSTFVDRGEGSDLLRQFLPITVVAPAVVPPAPELAATGINAETGLVGLLALILSSLGGVLLWLSRRSTRAGIRAQH